MPKGRWLALPLGVFLTGCGLLSGSGGGTSALLPPCPASGPELTALPLQPGDYRYVVPLGNLNPTGHVFPSDHHYFYLPLDGQGKAAVVPVFSMAKGWITRVSVSEHLDEGFIDYSLTVGVCRGFEFWYGHVSALSAFLRDAIAKAKPSRTETYTSGGHTFRVSDYPMFLAVAAGTPLGMAGGNPGQWALDVGASDRRGEQNRFANQDRYRNDLEWLIYAVSPLDFLRSDLKGLVDANVGGPDTRRTAEPIHGQISYDAPGTAMGNWFLKGQPSLPEDHNLALVKDPIDPQKYAISVGTALSGLAGRVIVFTPAESGNVARAFDEVVPGSINCYPTGAGRLLLRLQNEETLLAEYQAGQGCQEPMALSHPVTFVR